MIGFWRRLGSLAGGLFAAAALLVPLSASKARAGEAAIATMMFESDGQEGVNPAVSATKVVFANVKTLLQGWTEYNTSTCKLVETGTHKALSSPHYGKLTITTKSGPLSAAAGHCAGKVLPFSVVYYTWTDTKTKERKDPFKLRWFTSDGQFTIDQPWTLILGPRIYFNGKDVTNTTQHVALGQQMALTTVPVESGQTQSWKVTGKTVGGYITGKTAKVKPTDFTRNSTTFYWTTLEEKEVDYEVTRKNGEHGTAHATFVVQGPTGPGVTTQLGTVQIIKNNDLSFGNTDAKIPGIRFTEHSGASPKSGHFLWAQLIDGEDISIIQAGKTLHCSFGTGLDNMFPADTGTTTNDSPENNLDAAWLQFARHDTFRMFLLWQSSTAGSIPVPLGYTSWTWSATAVKNATTSIWSLHTSSRSAAGFHAGDAFPLWTKVVGNGSIKCN
jgi:hypothetical protein